MKNRPFKDDGFQHYYLRTEANVPYGVVVIAPGDAEGHVHRGIALRAAMDDWDRHEGRKVALGRVKKAMGIKASTEPVGNMNTDSVAVFITKDAAAFVEDHNVFKSSWNAVATAKEKPILENLLKKQTTSVLA